MSDHDFEKRVKQKMDELRFSPSDAVWTGVARELRKERPRRRWLWLSVMIIGIGSAGYFTINNYNKPGDNLSQNAPVNTNDKTAENNKTPEEENDELKKSSPAVSEASDVNSLTDKSESDKSPVDKSSIDKSAIDKSSIDKSAIVEAPREGILKEKISPVTPIEKETTARNTWSAKTQTKPNGLSDKMSTSPENGIANNKITNFDHSVSEKQSAANNKPVRKEVSESGNKALNRSSESIAKDQDKSSEKADSGIELTKAKNIAIPNETVANDTLQNDLKEVSAKNSDSGATKKQIAPTIAKTDPAVPVAKGSQKTPKKTRSWDWGLAASGGISNLSDGFLENVLKTTSMADAAPQSMMQASNNYVGAPNTMGVPPPAASAVKVGPYFSVGGFVRKKLSKSFSVSAGLRYTQYNNTINIGYRVDSSRLVNYGSQVMNVSRYYRANQNSRFSNRYYFLELPVSLHTQLNKSVTFPVIWNLDFSISQMLGSSALVFDSGTGVYYKDKSIYHKTQFGLGTGFSLGILTKSKTPLWIGPFVKYNATRLFTNDVSDPKHLLSAGLDLKVFINKK